MAKFEVHYTIYDRLMHYRAREFATLTEAEKFAEVKRKNPRITDVRVLQSSPSAEAAWEKSGR